MGVEALRVLDLQFRPGKGPLHRPQQIQMGDIGRRPSFTNRSRSLDIALPPYQSIGAAAVAVGAAIRGGDPGKGTLLLPAEVCRGDAAGDHVPGHLSSSERVRLA